MKCYFRIIRSNEATLEDFLPAKDLGRRLSNPDMEKEWANGISVCDTLEFAIDRALEFPKIGTHCVDLSPRRHRNRRSKGRFPRKSLYDVWIARLAVQFSS